MRTQDLQQLNHGFNTVAIIGAPYMVRVVEALDISYQGTKHRYFITVNLKFRESDALNIGKLGWLGVTKAEAMKEANSIASRLTVAVRAMESAKEQALLYDNFTNRFTVRKQEERVAKILNRYCATIEPNF